MQTRINGPVPVTVNTGPELNVLGQVRGAADDHPVGVSPPARKLPETFVFVFSRPQINDRRLSALYTLRLSSIWLYGHTHTHPMHSPPAHTHIPTQTILAGQLINKHMRGDKIIEQALQPCGGGRGTGAT